MAVSPDDIVLAAQYNTLRNRTVNLLGNGVGDFGYGQPVATSEVSRGTVITALQFENLRNDLQRIYRHQTDLDFTNSDPTNVLDTIVAGNTIGADESDGNVTKGYNDYLSILDTLEANRFSLVDNQAEDVPAITNDLRALQWSTSTIISEFTVSFATADARRHYFNSGGEVRISGDVTSLDVGTPSGARNQGWFDMITDPGEIQIGYNYIQMSNSGATNVLFQQGVNFGNYQLTSTYREVFRKTADTGTVYETSYWKIEARVDSPTTLKFRISLIDSNAGGTPEPVTADITMNYGGRRALGAPSGSSVTVPFPTYTITNSLQ